MFSYFGTKKKLAKYYPKPINDKIIEPFCGAAQYSLHDNNWEKDVVLIDKYDVIIDIWNYLINATEKDILSLPDMFDGDKVDDYESLSKEEKYLIGFCINSCSSQPKKTVKKFNSWNVTKKDISKNLHKIKHWKVIKGVYTDVLNEKATWFIDPPYSGNSGGVWYRHNNTKIDYVELGKWCLERYGQIIVCENANANWLPFKPLTELTSQNQIKRMEAIYYIENNQSYIKEDWFDSFSKNYKE